MAGTLASADNTLSASVAAGADDISGSVASVATARSVSIRNSSMEAVDHPTDDGYVTSSSLEFFTDYISELNNIEQGRDLQQSIEELPKTPDGCSPCLKF